MAVLRGEQSAASVFANTTDIGQSKETALRDVLKYHIPSSTNIYLGGFLFNLNGIESKQLDIIVSDQNSLNYNLHNKDGSGKSFGCIDGCVSVISSKSCLNRREIFDALANIASIPPGTLLTDRNSDSRLDLSGLCDGPVKAVYAQDGIKADAIASYLQEFYDNNPNIANNRRPNYIYVLGKYCLVRTIRPLVNDSGAMVPIGKYCLRRHNADLYFLSELLLSIEKIARLHRAVWYDYTDIFAKAVPPIGIGTPIAKRHSYSTGHGGKGVKSAFDP